jgi:hypothetical protein
MDRAFLLRLDGECPADLPPTHPFYAVARVLRWSSCSYGTLEETLNCAMFFGPFESYHRDNPFQYAVNLDGNELVIVQPIPTPQECRFRVIALSVRKSKTTFNGTEPGSSPS